LTQPKADLLQGTLDMLILKALSLGPLHGYGIIQRIRQLSDELLEVEQGSVYPAVYRTRAARLDQFRMGDARDRPPGQVLHAD
jgi:DNA-binding PadR family transcriptional regulator